MGKLWNRWFLEERSSIGLGFFRIFAALTTGFHVIPTFGPLADNYLHGALKTLDPNFFPIWFLQLVQRSPDELVVFFVFAFFLTWFSFLIGFATQLSCILMTLTGYYFYALNSFHIGTLSWDILLVTLFLLCLTPYPGDYFSVDALRKGNPEAYRTPRPFFLQRLLQMQIASTFFYTASYKIAGAGNWFKDNPIYYLMNNPVEGVTKLVLYKNFLAHRPELCYAIGVLIVVIELLLPFLLFYPRTRRSAIILGMIFHVFLILTFDVPAIFFFLFPAQLLLFIHPGRIMEWVDARQAYNRAGRQSILLFDGRCRFCQGSVRQAKVADLFGEINPVDFHGVADLKTLHPSLTKEIAASQLHLIEPGGGLSGGFGVVRRLSLKLPMFWPLILLTYFPGSGVLGPVVYRWVAKNRYLFHFNKTCESNACFR